MPKVVPEYLQQRRRQILDAAAACFAERGLHQTSMSDICERAGLSPGAVYRYFPGKEDIIAAICDEGYRQDLALIESIKADGSAREVMEHLAGCFLQPRDPPELRLRLDMLAQAPRTPHIERVLQAGNERILASFTEFIRARQATGEVNPNLDPDSTARVICALYHGFIVQQQLEGKADSRAFIDAVVAVFADGFFAGAVARAPGAAPPDGVTP